MEELYRSYLSFLRSMGQGLEKLTALNEKKLAAAQKDDLATLGELLNQEQAQALAFRGLEQTRDRLLPQLGLTDVPLSKVPDHCPPAMRAEARQTVETLQSQYQTYQKVSGKTRALLEQNLHEVEIAIREMGGPAAEAGPGYQRKPDNSPPPSMKTDFRA